VLLLDVTPLSLGIETLGGVFSKMVERNTTIPTHKSQEFSTGEDNQTAVDVFVFQGERPLARDNKSLGDFRLDGINPAPRGVAKIEVSFDIDANGIVNVAAKDQATGKEQKIMITASTNLTKDDIERLVKEAALNAAADHKAREEVDARNEADQVCYLIEHHLKEVPDKVRGTNRSRAQMLISALRQTLERRGSIDEIRRDTADLKGLLGMIQHDIASSSNDPQLKAVNQPQPEFTQTAAGSNRSSNSDAHADDDIIDAEITAA
jgi:molecular chaperone DnaK